MSSNACMVAALQMSHEWRVQKIVELVSCGASCTIRDLASDLRLSRSYVQRVFKQHTGMCLGGWLTEQRLQRAAHLLQHSHLSVKQITYLAGYEHMSSFTRAFERRFGRAPSVHRKRLKVRDCVAGTNSAGSAVAVPGFLE